VNRLPSGKGRLRRDTPFDAKARDYVVEMSESVPMTRSRSGDSLRAIDSRIGILRL
jgi:hypothetical protein